MKIIKLSACICLIAFLASCSYNQSRYSQANDSIPSRLPTAEEMKDPRPRIEPLSRGGNKDYVVWGKSYKVLKSAKGYVGNGKASWYGEKFHGHHTSNGEVYDMYAMTAAHKSLPLPSYVKVTNLENNKQIIVRVNDRGPFHEGRIIDLSFSAAYKLGMLKTGTANVKVEAITERSQGNIQVAAIQKPAPFIVKSKGVSRPQMGNNQFIQVFATRNKQLAASTAKGIKQLFQVPVQLPIAGGIVKIQVGPLQDQSQADTLLNNLKRNGYPEAFMIKPSRLIN